MTPRHEYRVEAIPFVSGPEGRTTAILNVFAAEGWRVVSLLPFMGRHLVATSLADSGEAPGVVVVLERQVRQG